MKADIEKLEKEALQKASYALSKIEVAISVWDASKKKPAKLKSRIVRLKNAHETLTRWSITVLKNKKSDEGKRLERLHNFVQICKTFA